jgi:putative oxygen-independent coproporphyrinogen III oxidase
MEDWQHGGFGLYVHWPFCQSKCPYCDFNSHVAVGIDQDEWATAYLSEIDRVGALTQGRVLQSVFFGGGTPSLMEPALVGAILERVRATWPTTNDWEVTLEANPGSVEVGRFRGFRDAGVNRVSLGVQALHDADLRRLGRMHTVAEARRAFDVARRAFDRVSFDLIYARQNQTLDGWRAELADALTMAVDHLSLYQLTIEDGTVFAERFAKGLLRGLPSEDVSAGMYEVTQELCDAAGLPAYEVSNHARPGAESRHNLIYWRAGDYAGIGPGAHGRISQGATRRGTVAWKMPQAWMMAVQHERSGDSEIDTLSGADRATEYALMAMRLNEGMQRHRYRALGGQENEQAMATLAESGHLVLDRDTVRTTPAGRLLLNEVLRRMLA